MKDILYFAFCNGHNLLRFKRFWDKVSFIFLMLSLLVDRDLSHCSLSCRCVPLQHWSRHSLCDCVQIELHICLCHQIISSKCPAFHLEAGVVAFIGVSTLLTQLLITSRRTWRRHLPVAVSHSELPHCVKSIRYINLINDMFCNVISKFIYMWSSRFRRSQCKQMSVRKEAF